MEDVFQEMKNALNHLDILHTVFVRGENFGSEEQLDYAIYKQNEDKLREVLGKLDFDKQLYNAKGRQMILADLLEYIFLGRGYYSMQSKRDRQNFVRAILYFVNLLMCYEVMTVSNKLRQKVLEELAKKMPELEDEEHYEELKDFTGTVGLKRGESDAARHLNNYFDSLLPKTAGGLWHELLVYIFLLRNDFGYIIPLLLSQRLMSLRGSIVPPDFLIITYDKHLYGIEVGTKKEIQSGSFSLQTAIPTATIDTINSRTSDRCPICKRWIALCPYVIENYSNLDKPITKSKVKCLDECTLRPREQIVIGTCAYTKYSRNKAKTLEYTHHDFANGLHYHYRCVLQNVSADLKNAIINAKDTVALMTHYPYYGGLEELMGDADQI